MPGVVIYKCPDGVNYSLHSDRRDCPVVTQAIQLGAGGGTRTRYLGSHGRFVTEAEAASLMGTPAAVALADEGTTVDRNRLLSIGVAAFALVLILLLLAKRRRK